MTSAEMDESRSRVAQYLGSLAGQAKVFPAYNPYMVGLHAALDVAGWRHAETEQPFVAAELFELVRTVARATLDGPTRKRVRFAPHTLAGHSLLLAGLPAARGDVPPGPYSAGRLFETHVIAWDKLGRYPRERVATRYRVWCSQRQGGVALSQLRGEIVAAMDREWPGLAELVLRRGARTKSELVHLLSQHGGRRCARIGEEMHDVMCDPGRTAQVLLRTLLTRGR